MKKYLLALLFCMFAQAASAQTQIFLGLQTGANPRTMCIFDTSNTCVNWGTVDSSAHTITLLNAVIPTPGVSALGGVFSLAATSHLFLTGLSNTGGLSTAQPAFTDISGVAVIGQIPTIPFTQLSGQATLAQLPSIAGLSFLGVSGTGTTTPAAITCAAANTVPNENAGATALQCTTLTSVLDSVAGSTRGSLLERGSGGWTDVVPSATAGTLLQSNGTGADPGYTAGLGQIKGTTTNDNASAGNQGEYIAATRAFGSAITLTSTTIADITTLSLTAGDWDVEGVGCAAYTTGAGTQQTVWVNTTSATNPGAGVLGVVQEELSLTAGSGQCFATGAQRFSLSASGTAYISINATFPNTAVAWGSIRARRAR